MVFVVARKHMSSRIKPALLAIPWHHRVLKLLRRPNVDSRYCPYHYVRSIVMRYLSLRLERGGFQHSTGKLHHVSY
jgi:hypothetical protein